MKYLSILFLAIVTIVLTQSCRSTKQISKVIATKDTTVIVKTNQTATDSLRQIQETMHKLVSHYIEYKTFNAKIKVEYEDGKGKKPDITAVVRIIKDSAIWVSLTATIVNLEVYRMLITKDSVIVMNRRENEVQYRSLDYLQEVTQIPFDYKTIQELLVGNPIFLDTTVLSFKKTEDKIQVFTVNDYFKHLLTLSADNVLLLHSKLDDVNARRNRTADITYEDYENKDGVYFSTRREITVAEKDKLDIRLKYKQYEFNRELSVSFKVPKNYTIK
jgi:hypothetical protein